MYPHWLNRTPRPMARAIGVAGLVAVAALLMAACGGSGEMAPSSPLGLIDQASRTVQLNLVITESSFNGYSTGQMTVRVPRGWRVDVYCNNQASTPRSCAVVSGATSSAPAFSGAASPDQMAGLPAGEAASFGFVAKTVGSYRLASLDPGHRDRNLWERFDVVATDRPSVSMSPQPGAAHATPGM